jgi:transposase
MLGAERSEAEPGEVKRSVAPGVAKTAPDPEVVPKAHRRQFTADYKKRILDEADAAKEPGAIGSLLRREGLYSSHLTHWRQQRDSGLAVHRRGPKPKRDPLAEEVRQLKLQNGQLAQRLARLNLSSMFKKKSRCCWGFRWRPSTATRAPHDRRRPGCSRIGSHRCLLGSRCFPCLFAS